MTYKGAFFDGIHFVSHRHFAYLGEDGEEWDYAECMNDGPVHDNPWRQTADHEDHEARSVAMDAWNALPEATRAWYEVLAVLPYDNILDIDENGDEYLEGHPHVYTIEFTERLGPFPLDGTRARVPQMMTRG